MRDTKGATTKNLLDNNNNNLRSLFKSYDERIAKTGFDWDFGTLEEYVISDNQWYDIIFNSGL